MGNDNVLVRLHPCKVKILNNFSQITFEFTKYYQLKYLINLLNRISINRDSENQFIDKTIDIINNKKENLIQNQNNILELNTANTLERIN